MEYDYRQQVKSDILNFIKNNNINFKDFNNLSKLKEYIKYKVWNEDCVTGVGSSSYFCDGYKAEEAVAHNWDLLKEAVEAFGYYNVNVIEKGPEWADLTIRCYLLDECIEEVLKEIKNKFDEEKHQTRTIFTRNNLFVKC